MQYRWEAATPDGFVRQVVQYVSSGHYFYFADQVGEHVDLGELDRKLLDEYGCELPPWTRSRRKGAGLASVHYLRHERFFVLVATTGRGTVKYRQMCVFQIGRTFQRHRTTTINVGSVDIGFGKAQEAQQVEREIRQVFI